jgi:hypothetical protein
MEVKTDAGQLCAEVNRTAKLLVRKTTLAKRAYFDHLGYERKCC